MQHSLVLSTSGAEDKHGTLSSDFPGSISDIETLSCPGLIYIVASHIIATLSANSFLSFYNLLSQFYTYFESI